MKELVVRAGKYFSVGIIFISCLPVLLPLLFVLSVLGLALGLPLGCALAGFLFIRKYVGMLYRKLPTSIAGGCSAWGRQPPKPQFLGDLPLKDSEAVETFESLDPEFDALVVSRVPVPWEVQRGSDEGDVSASSLTKREGTFVRDDTSRDDASGDDGTREEGAEEDTSNENLEGTEIVDDVSTKEETKRDWGANYSSADGGTSREVKGSTLVEDGAEREGKGDLTSEENGSINEVNEGGRSFEDGTRKEEEDGARKEEEDGFPKDGEDRIAKENEDGARKEQEDGVRKEGDDGTPKEGVGEIGNRSEGTDEDTFAEDETNRHIGEEETSSTGETTIEGEDITHEEGIPKEENYDGTQIGREIGATAFAEESELQDSEATQASSDEAGISSEARDVSCQVGEKEADPVVDGNIHLQHEERSEDLSDENTGIGSSYCPQSDDGQAGEKEAQHAVEEGGQVQPTGHSRDFSDEHAGTGSNHSTLLHAESPHFDANAVESAHEPQAEKPTRADSVNESSLIGDQVERKYEAMSSTDDLEKAANNDLTHDTVVPRVEEGGPSTQVDEIEAPGDGKSDSLPSGALRQFTNDEDKGLVSLTVVPATSDAAQETSKAEERAKPDGIRVLLPHQSSESDIWMCKECGWKYPNAKPSAKIRRNHKKHCKGSRPGSPAPEDGTLTPRLSDSSEGVAKLQTDSNPSSPLANSASRLSSIERNSYMDSESSSPRANPSPQISSIERSLNRESSLDGGTFSRVGETSDRMPERFSKEAALPTRLSSTDNSHSVIIQDEPESTTECPAAALAEEGRSPNSPLGPRDELNSPDLAQCSTWVTFDDASRPAVSSGELGGQDKESGEGSESFRSVENEFPSIASESFRSVPDEFPDKWASLPSMESHCDNEEDQVAQVQQERQLCDDISSVKGIVGDNYASTGNLLVDIEELSEFLGIDLPPRNPEMPEVEWAKLAIEVMKVVVGID